VGAPTCRLVGNDADAASLSFPFLGGTPGGGRMHAGTLRGRVPLSSRVGHMARGTGEIVGMRPSCATLDGVLVSPITLDWCDQRAVQPSPASRPGTLPPSDGSGPPPLPCQCRPASCLPAGQGGLGFLPGRERLLALAALACHGVRPQVHDRIPSDPAALQRSLLDTGHRRQSFSAGSVTGCCRALMRSRRALRLGSGT
jgi:hypothetical protein